jgi:hypothetical protein
MTIGKGIERSGINSYSLPDDNLREASESAQVARDNIRASLNGESPFSSIAYLEQKLCTNANCSRPYFGGPRRIALIPYPPLQKFEGSAERISRNPYFRIDKK